MKRLSFLLIALSIFGALPVRAGTGDPALSILQDHLSRVRLMESSVDSEETVLYSDLSAFLGDLVRSLRTTTGFCGGSVPPSDPRLGRCFRQGLRDLAARAEAAAVIDEVTSKNLKGISEFIIAEKGELKVVLPEESKPGPAQKFLKLFKRKQLPDGKSKLPGLLTYLQLKNFFSFRRVESGQPKELPPTLLQKMEKIYVRRVKSVGRVNPEEYLLSKYSRAQVWALSDLMKRTISHMNASAGKVVLAKVDYRKRFEQIEKIEQEITEIVESVAFDESDVESSEAYVEQQKTIALKRKQIEEIRATITPLVLEEKIAHAKADIQERQERLLRETSAENRSVLYEEIAELDSTLRDARSQIDREYIEIELSQGDVRRFAVNWLRHSLGVEKREGNLKGTEPTFGDIVAASLLTGEVKSSTVEAILDLEPFKEPKHVALKQWGGVAVSIVRTLSFLNPYTATAMTIGSIVFESVRSQKAYEKEQAKSDDLI